MTEIQRARLEFTISGSSYAFSNLSCVLVRYNLPNNKNRNSWDSSRSKNSLALSRPKNLLRFDAGKGSLNIILFSRSKRMVPLNQS